MTTDLLSGFDRTKRVNFVLRHMLQLARWQQPEQLPGMQKSVEEADDEWLNKSFLQFAEMYENDPVLIEERCQPCYFPTDPSTPINP